MKDHKEYVRRQSFGAGKVSGCRKGSIVSVIIAGILMMIGFSLVQAQTKDYKASLFGIKSNGTTLNTRSIQKAID